MAIDNVGISNGGSEELFNRLRNAINWVINRKQQVETKNVTDGKSGVVLQQEKAYKQGYIDALDHIQKLLENLSQY